MNALSLNAIVIPMFKEKLSNYEMISLQQCFAILEKHPIIFVCPQHLKNTPIHQEYQAKSEFIFLENTNFDSIIAYNEMLLSVWFYELFRNYKTILIHQLDCFVFKDELNSWIEKGYSYIGAPWFIGNSNNAEVNDFLGVGNGGFSLRNVKDCIKVLKSTKKVWSLKKHIQHGKYSKKKLNFLKSVKRYFSSNSFKSIHQNQLVNEDKVFCEAGKRLDFFKIPTPQQAIPFAFEMQPKKLYALNNNQLPFGCHAWWKYDLDFYIPHFEKFGHNLNAN